MSLLYYEGNAQDTHGTELTINFYFDYEKTGSHRQMKTAGKCRTTLIKTSNSFHRKRNV